VGPRTPSESTLVPCLIASRASSRCASTPVSSRLLHAMSWAAALPNGAYVTHTEYLIYHSRNRDRIITESLHFTLDSATNLQLRTRVRLLDFPSIDSPRMPREPEDAAAKASSDISSDGLRHGARSSGGQLPRRRIVTRPRRKRSGGG
jgi:hypothetical protein